MNVLRYLLDLLLPRYCASCKERLSTNEIAICPYCIRTLPVYKEGRAIDRLDGHAYIDELLALFSFASGNAVQRLIHSLKYDGYREVGLLLGRMAARKYVWQSHSYDLVIPVPLTVDRLVVRGFNQASLIARGLASETGLPVQESAVHRVGRHQSQTINARAARQHAVQGVFVCSNPEAICGKRILLVDDVLTTGATLSELARVLDKAGASTITVFVAAVATS